MIGATPTSGSSGSSFGTTLAALLPIVQGIGKATGTSLTTMIASLMTIYSQLVTESGSSDTPVTRVQVSATPTTSAQAVALATTCAQSAQIIAAQELVAAMPSAPCTAPATLLNNFQAAYASTNPSFVVSNVYDAPTIAALNAVGVAPSTACASPTAAPPSSSSSSSAPASSSSSTGITTTQVIGGIGAVASLLAVFVSIVRE